MATIADRTCLYLLGALTECNAFNYLLKFLTVLTVNAYYFDFLIAPTDYIPCTSDRPILLADTDIYRYRYRYISIGILISVSV